MNDRTCINAEDKSAQSGSKYYENERKGTVLVEM